MTLLELINKALKRVALIKGEAGELTSLTDPPRQIEIDIMVQAVNEVFTDLMNMGCFPLEAAEGKFTLSTDKREYNLPSDFEAFITRPLDEVNGLQMWPYRNIRGQAHLSPPGPGDYVAMREFQLQPDAYSGQPYFYAINPENGKLRLDYAPTSGLAGRVYRFTYRKTLEKTAAADELNMTNETLNKLMPAIKEVWNRERKEKFDQPVYFNALAGAARHLTKTEPRRYY